MFNLSIPRIGYVVAVKYERKYKFNLVCESIYRSQLKKGFNKDEAAYVHVAISSGGQHMVNIIPPRTTLIDIRKKYNGCYVKILKYDGIDFDNKNRYKIACLYNALASNLRYDIRGVISFILPFIKQLDSTFFCSEACCTAFQMIYPSFLGPIDPSKCLPAHFVKTLDLVWEGYI